MKRWLRSRWIVVSVVGALLISAVSLVAPPLSEAHCTGSADLEYASGNHNITVGSNGVRASIEWTNPNVCSYDSSHSISLLLGVGWLQVGWWKTTGGVVQGYCEVQNPFVPGSYAFNVFTVSAATHGYKFQYDTFDGFWDCFLDNSGKFSYSSGFVGFTSSSDSITVQGETHAEHGQIGRMSPAKLLFFDMQYRRTSDGQWPAVNIQTLNAVNFPYGRDEPAVGQLRVWTNAH